MIKKRFFSFIAIVCLQLLYIIALFGNTFHVESNGNDITGDGSQENPWKTLSFACSQVTSFGNTIYVKAGIYTDNVQCVLAPGVNIKGEGKNLVTIISNLNDRYIKAESYPVVDGNQRISGFTLDGNNRVLKHGVSIIGRNYVTIEDMDFIHIQDKAIQIEGYDWWNNANQDWPPVPPPGYAIGNVIRNVNITGCSKAHDGGALNAALWIQSVEDCLIENVVIDESASSGGQGNALKSWPGWIKHCTIRNSQFTVNPNNGTPIPIEIWNFEKDTEIYNCTFDGGYLSLVSGRKNGGTWALKFHDNKVNWINPFGAGHELSLDDLDFYNNYITNYNLSVWVASHMYNLDGLNNVRIRNNVIESAPNQGININAGTPSPYPIDNIQIYNNVIIDVTQGWPQAGIQVKQSSDVDITNLKIQNNIIQNIGATGVYFRNSNGYINRIINAAVTYNDFYNVPAKIQDDGVTNPIISDNLDIEPQFIATGSKPIKYYSLDSKSPLIDAGTDVGLPFKDKAPDIGPFELLLQPPTGLRVYELH